MKHLDELNRELFIARNNAIRNSIKRQLQEHLPEHLPEYHGDIWDWEPDMETIKEQFGYPEDEDFRDALHEYIEYMAERFTGGVKEELLNGE